MGHGLVCFGPEFGPVGRGVGLQGEGIHCTKSLLSERHYSTFNPCACVFITSWALLSFSNIPDR